MESLIILHVWPQGSLPLRALTGLHINVQAFEPKRLFMESIYLLVMGLLLGYLAERQKQLRAEKALVTGMLSRVRVEAGLTGTIDKIFQEITSMYGASRVMFASQEIHSKRVFLGELNPTKGNGGSEFTWLQSGARDAKTYLDDYPARSLTPLFLVSNGKL